MKTKQNERRNKFMKNLLLVCQDAYKIGQGKDEQQMDGFPLVLVFFDVVQKSVQLIKKVRKRKNMNKYTRAELKTLQKDQETFRSVCIDFFDSNVYECLNEFIFHMMMNFLMAWKHGITKMLSHYKWNAT